MRTTDANVGVFVGRSTAGHSARQSGLGGACSRTSSPIRCAWSSTAVVPAPLLTVVMRSCCFVFCVLGVWSHISCTLSAEGMKPKAIASAISALHDQPINHRAVQNAAAAYTRARAQNANRPSAERSENLNETNGILTDVTPPAQARSLVQSLLGMAHVFANPWRGRSEYEGREV